MKKILLVILLIFIITIKTNATETKLSGTIECSNKNAFERYSCQVEKICKAQEYGQNNQKITKIEQKYDKETNFDLAKKIYRNIQGQIYKCAIINSQKKAFKELIILLQQTDNSGILKTSLIPILEQKLQRIENVSSRYKCVNLGNSPKKVIKKIVLDQSSLEYCKYMYFLDYLQDQEENNIKLPEGKKSITAGNLGNIIIKNNSKISSEMDHTVKMYTIAFENYVEYDNYIKLHIMLEAIKQDYRTLRNLLYQNLHPINQTVYKVINAQSY